MRSTRAAEAVAELGSFAATVMLPALLTNRVIEAFTIDEFGLCSVSLSGAVVLRQEALLRYVGPGVFISACDHGQKFGLPAPYDAAREIGSRIVGRSILQATISPDTGDLTLVLDGGRLEIICTSAGYEAYQVYGPDGLVIVGRGGSVAGSEPSAPANRHEPSASNRESGAGGG